MSSLRFAPTLALSTGACWLLGLACQPAAAPTPDKTSDVTAAAATAAPTSSAAPPGNSDEGKIECGSDTCDAATQLCCSRFVGANKPRATSCVSKPAPVADSEDPEWDSAKAGWDACGQADFKRCDSQGDCGSGETCCEETAMMPDSNSLTYASCRPLDSGKIACGHDELCSAADPSCVRDNSSCNGTVCEAPMRRKLTCGDAPCPAGQTCARGKDDKLACTASAGHSAFVHACEGGSDCPADASCILNSYTGTRCDRALRDVMGREKPICKDKSDCAAFCSGASDVALCTVGPDASDSTKKHCECRASCEKDADCASFEGCSQISMFRSGTPSMAPAFCDPKTKLCDCPG